MPLKLLEGVVVRVANAICVLKRGLNRWMNGELLNSQKYEKQQWMDGSEEHLLCEPG